MTEPLLPRVARFPAFVTVVVCAVVTAVLGWHYADTYAAGRIDRAIDLRIRHRLAADHHVLRNLLHLGDLATVATLTAFLVLLCLARGRLRAAVLSATGPPIAGGLTELVLKPLIGRHIGHALSSPSGHTTGA